MKLSTKDIEEHPRFKQLTELYGTPDEDKKEAQTLAEEMICIQEMFMADVKSCKNYEHDPWNFDNKENSIFFNGCQPENSVQ